MRTAFPCYWNGQEWDRESVARLVSVVRALWPHRTMDDLTRPVLRAALASLRESRDECRSANLDLALLMESLEE